MVLLFGFLTGLALVAPIGPVSLTLVGLGAEPVSYTHLTLPTIYSV